MFSGFIRKLSWRRLRIRVILASLGLLVLALGGFTMLTVTQQSKRLLSLAKQEAEALGANTAASLIEWTLREDIDKLSEVALRTVSLSQVESFSLLDTEGYPMVVVEKVDGMPVEVYEVAFEALPSEAEVKEGAAGRYLISWAPIQTETVIGWLRLEYSLEELVKMKQQLIRRGLAFLALFLGVAALIFWRLMDRPLREIEGITEFSSSLAQMDEDVLEVRGCTDETRKLAKTLNRASQQIRENWDKLQAARDHLELRVEERTRDLAQTIERLEDEMEARKKAEAQLLHMQKMESVGELAAGIAHEINTPMQYVGGNLEFLDAESVRLLDFAKACQAMSEEAKGEHIAVAQLQSRIDELDLEFLEEELVDSVRQSIEGVEQVTRIVKSVKQYSHPGGSEKSAYDVASNLRSTIDVSRNEWKYHAEVHAELPEDLPAIEAYGGELNQVFVNLIVNAAHAIEDRRAKTESADLGNIQITAMVKEDFLSIRVRDDGMGIAEEHLNRIYDPFFTTKEVGKGTGQGLNIAWQVVVEKHGGRIEVESEAGKGTSFEVLLPVS